MISYCLYKVNLFFLSILLSGISKLRLYKKLKGIIMLKTSCILKLLLIVIIFYQYLSLSIAEQVNTNIELKRFSDNIKYSNAVLLNNLNQTDKALEEFQEYLEIFIHGIHRKEAYNHIARIFFDQYNFLKAAEIYRSLYAEFSNTDEGVEAYYTMGICYKKMDYSQKAHTIFKSILRDHSNTEYAYLSKIQIDLLEILNEGV